MTNLRAILLLGVLTIGFYWKLTLSRRYTVVDSPDLSYMVLPWYQFQARAFHRGVFPLWNPYEWCGQTFAGQLQPGVTFPLNWPLFLAPLRNGRINLDFFHWHYTLMHWLAAIFMYAYCRELGRGYFASILGGSAFSFAGFVGLTSWPQMMNGAIWTPLIFLFHHRAGRAGSGRAAVANAAASGAVPAGSRQARASGRAAVANAAACGASIGMALLAGHHKAPLFVVLALTGVFLYELWSAPAEMKWPRLRLFVITAIFAALTGAFALIPGWELNARAYRWVNLPSPVRLHQTVSYLAQQGQEVTPESLLGLVTPVIWDTRSPFIGLVSVSLALLGLSSAWQKRCVCVHACVALGGLAYALGSYSVFQGALYAVVPVLNKAQSPGHAVLLFHFGLLVIAAYGADALFTAPWRGKLARGLAVSAGLLLGARVVYWMRGGGMTARWEALLLTAMIGLLLAGLIYGHWKNLIAARVVQVGVLLLLMVELSPANANMLLPRTNPQNPNFLDRLAQHRGPIEFLRAQPRPFRFHADEDAMPHNVGDWDELEDTASYLATVSADLFDFVGLDWTRVPLMMNQVYVVAKEKTRPQQEEVFRDPGGLKVFRNPDAYPRTWLVAGARVAGDWNAAMRLMNSPDFDPKRETFLLARLSQKLGEFLSRRGPHGWV